MERIDRYEIRGELGRGGQGTVFLAYDPKLDREVAIKVMNVSHDNRASVRFAREARATAKLHHPNVVEIFDFSTSNEQGAYIVSERLDGATLAEILALRAGPLPLPVAAAVLHEVCLALQHAHDRGVLHRDLKPENVFWERSGRVVLVDFGIARDLGQIDTTTNVRGTPQYLAPESIVHGQTSIASDIFALGATFYFLLTKRDAFAAASMFESCRLIVNGRAQPLSELRPDLPEALVQLVDAMMARDPASRPPSAVQVSDTLLSILADCGMSDPRRALRDALNDLQAHTEPLGSVAPRPMGHITCVTPRRRRWSRLVLALAVFGVGAFALVRDQPRAMVTVDEWSVAPLPPPLPLPLPVDIAAR